MPCRRRARRCCCAWPLAPIAPTLRRSLFDGARLTTRHADRRGFRIVQIDRGQRAAPNTAGVEWEYTVRTEKPECRPMAEHQALRARGARRYLEPRQPGGRRRIRLAFLAEVHATIGGAEAQPCEHVDCQAQSIQ